MTRPVRLAIVALLAVLIAACGPGGGGADQPQGSAPADSPAASGRY